MVSKLIDVSHTVAHGLVTYKGLPAPVICDYLSREASREHYAAGTEFHIGKIEMVANTGTYVDSPFHRYADGKDLAELPLSSLANLDCVVVRVPGGYGRSLQPDLLDGQNLQGKAVLFDTGWSQHWNSARYFEGHPFLSAETAVHLQQSGVVLVGIDSYNIDDTADGRRPVHSTLLRHDIPIVEHLAPLHALPDANFRFFAVPVKVQAFGTFPVRSFGLV